ncbi:MAG: hypothetical protein KTR24_08835 [Saprospiraceae bacterium]|nr:hypothetical protein [Saprospiraceae bacterium]
MEEIESNKNDRRRGWMTSFAVHALLILLALLPLLTYEDPPPGQQGVLVSFGQPDMGSGDDRPETQQEDPTEEAVEESAPEIEEVEEETEQPPEEAIPEPIEEVQESAETLPEEVVTTDQPDEVAIQKQKEEEARKQQEELERKRQAEEARKKAEAEAEAKRKAEAEAKRKAEYEAAKKQFGDVFGEGKGKNDEAGNQGDPDGDPDASKLEGVSTGSGMVGGGLGGRGVVFVPKIKDDSQKTGIVVVSVCVDQNGNVSSAKYTQKGSTTADSELRNIAISNAKKFRFSKSSTDKQCGTITIDFRVR